MHIIPRIHYFRGILNPSSRCSSNLRGINNLFLFFVIDARRLQSLFVGVFIHECGLKFPKKKVVIDECRSLLSFFSFSHRRDTETVSTDGNTRRRPTTSVSTDGSSRRINTESTLTDKSSHLHSSTLTLRTRYQRRLS